MSSKEISENSKGLFVPTWEGIGKVEKVIGEVGAVADERLKPGTDGGVLQPANKNTRMVKSIDVFVFMALPFRGDPGYIE